MTLDEAKDLALREKEAEIAALKLELRALQPDEQMSLLRVAQRERDEARNRISELIVIQDQSRAREEALEKAVVEAVGYLEWVRNEAKNQSPRLPEILVACDQSLAALRATKDRK